MLNRERYGELMSVLLRRREKFDSDEKFRGFVIDSVRTFCRDLKDLNVDIAIRSDITTARRSSRDWNSLHFGCE